MCNDFTQGSFTLPGEAGYEKLTLDLARKWGADVIRDSDGTHLSDEIVQAGYGIYSTICIIRQHNAFAAAHPDSQQQTFQISKPVVARSNVVAIPLMDGIFSEQMELNDTPEALPFYQVYDRTTGTEVPRDHWAYADGTVTINNATAWHEYTASFLCWRIWEEINMYNHTTNHWTSDHLRQLDPRHPAAWAYLQKWLEDWCKNNPDTTVVRFTSLFYNFVWMWGSSDKNRHLFTDWASYDFTVSPAALNAFEKEYGYALTAEDFVNGGRYQVTHMPPTAHKKDYMAFIQRFVAEKAKVLVDIVHKYGKKAYVFYDDSWVGMEPYGPHFETIGFDGLIKCVFSGFECRLCAGVKVPAHEIRLHPYLFPVGLGGLPTFSEGGNPAKDALDYWRNLRRALARQCVDRIGLGGYLHLTQGYPDFVETIRDIGMQFRRIKHLCAEGLPYVVPSRVAVLHRWGRLRSWTLSGHFHETDQHILIHINEALSGLPLDVQFIDFEDVRNGALKDFDVVINAGQAGDAWSGGDAWQDAEVLSRVTQFVDEGGAFIGVGDPTAAEGGPTLFRLANVLGIDRDTGARVCHGKWPGEDVRLPISICEDVLGEVPRLYLTDEHTQVLCRKNGIPQMTLHAFGKGHAAYLSSFQRNTASIRMLFDLILYLTGHLDDALYITDDARAEAAYYPASQTLLVFNNTDEAVTTTVRTPAGGITVDLAPMETKII